LSSIILELAISKLKESKWGLQIILTTILWLIIIMRKYLCKNWEFLHT
jgi:hypothetical protein